MSVLRPIVEGDWERVRTNFVILIKLLIDTGGKRVGMRWGTQAITFTASALSDLPTVTHGLDRIPAIVLAVPNDRTIVVGPFNKTATTFQVAGSRPTGATTLVVQVDWLVIG